MALLSIKENIAFLIIASSFPFIVESKANCQRASRAKNPKV